MENQKLPQGMSSGYLPEWWAALNELHSLAAHAVQFMTLTARRAEEVLKMQKDDLDLRERIWTIKVSPYWEPVRVPLCKDACDIAKTLMKCAGTNDYLFPADIFEGRTAFDAMAAITYRNPCAVELQHERRMGEIADYPVRCAFHRWAEKQGVPEHDLNMILDIRNRMDDEIDPAVHRSTLGAWAKHLEDHWWVPEPETSMPF